MERGIWILAVMLLAASGCGSSEPLHLQFPSEDYLAAFVHVFSPDGKRSRSSSVFALEGGRLRPDREAESLEFEEGDDEVLLVGFRGRTLEAADRRLKLALDDPSQITVEAESESCAHGRLDGQTHRLRFPTQGVGEVWRWEGSNERFERADGSDLLAGLSVDVPVDPRGCASGDGPFITPLLSSGLPFELPARSVTRLRLDADRVVIGTPRSIHLFDRRSANPTKAISTLVVSSGSDEIRLAELHRRRDPSTGAERLVALLTTLSSTVSQDTLILEVKVEASQLRQASSFIRLPGISGSLTVDREARLVVMIKEGTVWTSTAPQGRWSASTELRQEDLKEVRSTDSPSAPHLAYSRESGRVLLGDLHSFRVEDLSYAASGVNEVTSHLDELGLELWSSTQTKAAFEPPAMLHRAVGGTWQREEILVPTGFGSACSEEVECGRRRLLGALGEMHIRGRVGAPSDRLYALPDNCLALLTVEPRTYCTGLLALEGQVPEASGRLDTLQIDEDRLTVFDPFGAAYEVELGPLPPELP